MAQTREGYDGLADVVVAADDIAVVRRDAQLGTRHRQSKPGGRGQRIDGFEI